MKMAEQYAKHVSGLPTTSRLFVVIVSFRVSQFPTFYLISTNYRACIVCYYNFAAINPINEYVRSWQETETLYMPPRLMRAEIAYRPVDLATLFSTVAAKIALDSFDGALGKYKVFQTSSTMIFLAGNQIGFFPSFQLNDTCRSSGVHSSNPIHHLPQYSKTVLH